MEKTILRMATISALLVSISACGTQRPVLSSNAHLMRVGPSVAEGDIDQCMRQAKSNERGDVSKQDMVAGTAANSAVGAAAGGAGGAVVGRAGQGAAAGAAGGAAAGLTAALLRGLLTSNTAPDPSHRGFVDRCLREKGYEPTGWK